MVLGPVSQDALAAPKIRLSPEVFDFGYMPAGGKVIHRYWLSNDGADTLKVSKVVPSCGCTTVPLPRHEIAPADSVPLDLVFNAGKITGVVTKTVSVESNDPDHVTTKVSFTARVADKVVPVEVTPWTIELTEIDVPESKVRVKNTSKNPVTLTLAVPDTDRLTVSPEVTNLTPGSSADLTIRRKSGSAPGLFETSITFLLEGPVTTPLTIPVKGMVYIE